ncbi:MAG: hypothetical protein COB31_06315 [Erythrobacter sp.]|nr:MAG: hypothetical protein COB31_06315 [Erythrobacter sp.]
MERNPPLSCSPGKEHITERVICIWCLNDFPKLSLEHGIPEALGCPPDLELRDTTCAECNNRLGTIDQALLKSFEAISVMYGVHLHLVGLHIPVFAISNTFEWSPSSNVCEPHGHSRSRDGKHGRVGRRRCRNFIRLGSLE